MKGLNVFGSFEIRAKVISKTIFLFLWLQLPKILYLYGTVYISKNSSKQTKVHHVMQNNNNMELK